MSESGNVNVGEGGQVTGPVIGQNTGQVTVNYNTHQHPVSPPIDLAEALALLDRLPLDRVLST